MKFGKIGLTCLSLFLLSAVSIAAFAQDNGQPPAAAGGARPGRGQGGGQRGGRGAALVTIPVSVMDSYLKLTADQKAKITAIQTQYKEDSKAFAPVPGGAQADPQAAADMRQKRQDTNQKADADIKAVLTDDQTKMVADMNKDLQSYNMVGIPVGVLGDLKLTASEKSQLATIATDAQKDRQAKMQELQQNGGDRAAMQAAFAEMQKATHDKVMAVLTASQKTTLESYMKDHPQPQFGGGRRGGAAGAPPGGGAPPRN